MKLDSEELQGFAISDPYAPFVFINSDDWNAPQLFTLVPELAHIWIAESGISNEIEPGIDVTDTPHPVELFCNKVAANALMPEEIISNISRQVFQNPGELFLTARTFGISSFLLQVNRNSRLFTQHILDAYRGGSIEPSMASQLLNVQVNKFQKLEGEMYQSVLFR